MVISLVAALALSTQAAPTGEADAYLIADCHLARIDFQAMRPTGDMRRFVLLLRMPEGARGPVDSASIRVFDPTALLGGAPLASASFREDGSMMFAQTDDAQPVFYRFAAGQSSTPGEWRASIGMNGQGSAEEHQAHSYMGLCAMRQPGDAVAEFEGLGSAQ